MSARTTLTAGFIAAQVATQATAADDPGATHRELMALEDAAMERWRRGDPMAWAEIAAPEVTYVDPGLAKPVVGIDEYRRYLETLKGKVRYDGSEYLGAKTAVYGDLAVLTYNYQATSQQADGSVTRHQPWNTTEVYARSGGRWRIIHTHWSFVNHVLPDQLELPLPVELRSEVREGLAGELLGLERAAMLRWRRGDPAGFLELGASEVTYFDAQTPRRLDGLEALRQEYRKLAGKVRFEVMEFVRPNVQAHGDAAVVSYRFLSTQVRSDGSVAQRTPWNCTEVYAKRDAWRIVHTHWSLIAGRPADRTTPAGP